MIIDEADTLIYNETKQLVDLLGNAPCIALTGTPDNTDEQGVESAVTTRLQFACFRYTGNKEMNYE